LEKWVTIGKMGHTWKNGSHLEKWVTLGKMGLTLKNGSHLENSKLQTMAKYTFLKSLKTKNYGKNICVPL